MERDEVGTLARLKAHRRELVEPLIAEHEGRMVKLMGDGALCEFGSVVDAVQCAVRVQQGMAERDLDRPEDERIRFRIGINLGDVIHEADGDIYGDGVNIAARLEGLAEPGGILISGSAYDQVEGKLPLALHFAGEQRVKNIERSVRTYRVDLAASPEVPAWRRVTRAGRRRMVVAASVGLMLVLGAGVGGWWWQHQRQAVAEVGGLPLPDKPAIAVLPLANLSGDPKWERIADGITEDIITDLARSPDLLVIARNSTMIYKGQPVDTRKVGRDLGVRYVLEGSLQADAGRVRVTAQLIDATTGGHLWAERYDRPEADLFAIQDEVARSVASALGG